MNDPVKKALFKEIAGALGDFYLAQARDFIKGLPKKEAWYDLSTSQIKRLQDIFPQADKESAQKNTSRHEARKKMLEEFLRAQVEKEQSKHAESFWQILFKSPKNLLTFLFPHEEKILADLREHVQQLISFRGQQYPDGKDIDDYLTPTADQKSALYHWQRHELLPLITEKLLHTLITLHRLRNAECYKDEKRKEWLPC